MSCTEIQEQLAWGKSLSPEQRAHAAECPLCLKLAADYSLLDETVNALTARVPATFADRVMAQVIADAPHAAASRLKGWLGERWVQFALVYGGSVVAAINLVRFLASVLTTSASLGGAQ